MDEWLELHTSIWELQTRILVHRSVNPEGGHRPLPGPTAFWSYGAFRSRDQGSWIPNPGATAVSGRVIPITTTTIATMTSHRLMKPKPSQHIRTVYWFWISGLGNCWGKVPLRETVTGLELRVCLRLAEGLLCQVGAGVAQACAFWGLTFP